MKRVMAFVFKDMGVDEVERVLNSLPSLIKSGDDFRSLLAAIITRYDIDEVEKQAILRDVSFMLTMAAQEAAIKPTHTGSERIN